MSTGRRSSIDVGLATVIFGLLSPPASAAPVYLISDLGTLGGSYSLPHSINNNGQIVGLSFLTGNFGPHAFLWRNGTGLEELSTLGGSLAQAMSINTNGKVAGSSRNIGDAASRAVIWTFGLIQELPTLGGNAGRAMAVNDLGAVTGAAELPGNTTEHAFVWQASSPSFAVDLGTLGGGNSQGSDINATGEVAGYAEDANGITHAARWSPPYGAPGRDLGTLGGTYSEAFAINASGQVTGISSDTGDTRFRGFVWNAGQGMSDLGALSPNSDSSAGLDINSSGDVVGYSTVGANGDKHAILRKAGQPVTDLNGLILPDPGWLLTEARSINDSGQIVGIAIRSVTDPLSGTSRPERHAFLLTPDIDPPAIVCPVNISAASPPSSIGQATATDNLDPAPSVTNDAPASFPGNTVATVVWTATDAAGNQSSCRQTVTVGAASTPTPVTPTPVTPTPVTPTPVTPTPVTPTSVTPAPATSAATVPIAPQEPLPLPAPKAAIASPDLQLTGSVKQAPRKIKLNKNLTYSFLIENLGTVTASEPSFVDALDKRLRFVSARASAGVCQTPKRGRVGGVVSCRLPAVAPGEFVSVEITVSPKKRGLAPHSATLSSASIDADSRNNTAEVLVTVR